MKYTIVLILALTGLSLQAQTNIIHSQNAINKSGTNGFPFQFVFQSQWYFTNNEHRGFDEFTNSTPGGVMTFSCDPTNDTVCYFSSFPLQVTRSYGGTNSVTWTNLPGEQYYMLYCASNKKMPAKPVTGIGIGFLP